MRVLVSQTPKLTYIQILEILTSEVAHGVVDLACFPEMAMEHPSQVTSHGALTTENMGLLMLSRFAINNRTYLVLGSVEELDSSGNRYETCVVIGRAGEIVLKYRKQLTASFLRARGEGPGVFQTEFGVVGVLLGQEIEQPNLWLPILRTKPCLVLNPSRTVQSIDPVLIRAHPKLQVTAWLRSFSLLKRILEGQLSNHLCSFVRADAPLQDGGTGSSCLIEPHRSIMAPCWTQAFFVVETMQSHELPSMLLPGWKPIEIDELVDAAMKDRGLSMNEELQRGPRYQLWRVVPERFPIPKALWGEARALAAKAAAEELDISLSGQRATLVEMTTLEGEPIITVAACSGSVVLWGLKSKCEIKSYDTTSAVPTAIGLGRSAHEFLLVTSTDVGFDIRLFEVSNCLETLMIRRESLPWDQWQEAEIYRNTSSADSSEDDERPISKSLSEHDKFVRRARGAFVRSIRLLKHPHLFLIIEVLYGEYMPQGLVVDIETGHRRSVDIYGTGPPAADEDDIDIDEEGETVEADDEGFVSGTGATMEDPPPKPAPIPRHFHADRLISASVVEQQFEGQPKQTPVMVLVYASNRICYLDLLTFQLSEIPLLEFGCTMKQRRDEPKAASCLVNKEAGFCHLFVIYKSLMMKWWLISFTKCRVQSQVVLDFPAVQLTFAVWPVCGSGREGTGRGGATSTISAEQSPSQRSPSKAKRLTLQPVNAAHMDDSKSRRKSSMLPKLERYGRSGTSLGARWGSRGDIATPQMDGGLPFSRFSLRFAAGAALQMQLKQAPLPPDAFAEIRSPDCSQSIRSGSKQSGRRTARPIRGANKTDFSFEDWNVNVTMLVAVVDHVSNPQLYLCQGEMMRLVYNFREPSARKIGSSPSAVLFTSGGLAVLLANGELRFFEFWVGDHVIEIGDIPLT